MDDYQKLLNNLGNDALAQWHSLDIKPLSLTKALDDLSCVIQDSQKLNQAKKISAAKIGEYKKSGKDFSHLLEQQKQLKAQLKHLKTEKKRLEETIRTFFENQNKCKNLPGRFEPITEGTFTQTLSSINIINIDRLNNADIDSYVDKHLRSTPYHYSCWRELIKSLFKHDDISLAAIDQHDNVVGYLPLIRLKSYLFGDFVVSMPYFNYGGPLSDDLEIENKLINSAVESCSHLGLEHLELRELKAREGLESKQEKVSMIRPLPQSIEQLSREIGSKLRAQINRSKALSPEVRIGKLELINDFYKVFSINMRDLGTPVYGKEFFYRAIESWYDASNIITVYIDKHPVASAMLLGYRNMLEIPWASALKKTNKSGINMFMYWNILKFAIENGYDYFDFGRSSQNSGTYKFKQQWGAEPRQNYWNYWIPEGKQLPQINPDNVKYKLLISAWKKLPVSVSNLIGPPIVKNIP